MPAERVQSRLGVASSADFDALCRRFTHQFEAQIATRGAGDWIISAEHLQSRLIAPEQVERLAAFLRRFFSEIEVHIHLRPQVDVARSLASTGTRLGLVVGPKHFDSVHEGNPYYNYARLVARWERVFGAAQVRLVPYKRQPSILAYFLDKWQLQPSDFSPEYRINRAVDWRLTALINTLTPQKSALPLSQGLERAINALPAEQVLQIGLPLAQAIAARMHAANEALVAARPELSLDDLTPDWANYEAPENLSKVTPTCAFAPQMIGLVEELQSELMLEKARTEVLRAKLQLAEGRTATARKTMETAAALLLQIEPIWGERKPFLRLQTHMTRVVLDQFE